jgi:RNA polymerase sigma factor (sigma-70 family)
MVQAMRTLPGEQRTIELKPWLFRVAHNESVSLLRRRPADAVLDEKSEGPAVDGPEVGLVSREELRELVSDLRELPDRQRAAVILRELNGLSFREIGSVFGTSTAAAKQAAYDGRVALQDYAKGRAMDCEVVTRAISDGDKRFLRGRKARGHLRSCAECSSFTQALEARSSHLAALAPALPQRCPPRSCKSSSGAVVRPVADRSVARRQGASWWRARECSRAQPPWWPRPPWPRARR